MRVSWLYPGAGTQGPGSQPHPTTYHVTGASDSALCTYLLICQLRGNSVPAIVL